MDASCGPSNALQNLSKHTQRDNSLQHEFRPQQQERPGFKQGNHVDARLNQNFNQFTGGQGNEFASQFMNLFNPQQFQKSQQNGSLQNGSFQSGNFQNGNLQHQPQNQNQPVQFNGNQKWVNDFSQMSINNTPMSQNQVNHNQNQYQHQPLNGLQSFPLNMRTNLSTPLIPQQAPEHMEMHKYEQSLDKQFELVEQELQEKDVASTHNHDEFAKIAKTIHNSMSQGLENPDMADKFKNSQFMDLMNQVSQRQVELDGKDLVYSSTKQKFENEHTPQSSTILESHNEHMPTYHHPQFDSPVPPAVTQAPEPRPDQINRLPDPLAHIKDGQLQDINDPMMMAQIISGGQVKNKDWLDADTDWLDSSYTAPKQRMRRSIMTEHEQEVFDDYRNDDDFH